MKRSLADSDSLAGFISICHTTSEEHSPTRSNNNNTTSHVYNREYQSMLEGLDEDGCLEESGHVPEKKRRLSVDQVKALEKNFEVENKLEPERKVKLAQELGLQPRQVAVWFQNRRARWKTKQLERDYGVLKANYDALKLSYENLQHDKEALLKEIRELKAKLQEDKTESNLSVKEEQVLLSDSEKNPNPNPNPTQNTKSSPLSSLAPCEPNYFHDDGGNGLGAPFFPDFKDGSSDSDSSAILNEDPSPNQAISSSCVVLQNNQSLVMSPTSFNHCSSSPSSSSMNCFEFQKVYQPQQFVKMEEHNFLSADEACNFFDDDQVPTLPW